MICQCAHSVSLAHLLTDSAPGLEQRIPGAWLDSARALELANRVAFTGFGQSIVVWIVTLAVTLTLTLT